MESANENANGVDGGQVVHNGGSTVARVNYGGRINLTHELLRLIKSNDPNVTELEADFSLGSTLPCPANSIDWTKEIWSFFENSHLEWCKLDIFIRRAPAPKELENVKAFLKALSRSRSIKSIDFDISDRREGELCSILGDVFSILSPLFKRLERFEMINTEFDDKSVQSFCLALESCGNDSSLKGIEFDCNRTTSEQAGIIIDAINIHCNNLLGLKWGRDNGEGYMGRNAFIALSRLVGNPSSTLEELDFGEEEYDEWDEGVQEVEGTSAFATALANNTKLKVINFGGGPNFFSESEWRTMSSILRNPDAILAKLDLTGKVIGDEGVNGLARGLSTNKSLTELNLNNCRGVSSVGWIALLNALTDNKTLKFLSLGCIDAVTQLHINPHLMALSHSLCDGSSINATFGSNHTLERIWMYSDDWQRAALPPPLADALQLNRNGNKLEVARQKILRYHDNEDSIQEFVDMEWQVLPHAMAWIGRDDTGLSLLYRFVQGMPDLFDRGSKLNNAGGMKRKRCIIY